MDLNPVVRRAFLDELEKLAASRFRRELELVQTPVGKKDRERHELRFRGEPLAAMVTEPTLDGRHVRWAGLSDTERYKGMGFGKKLYGEMMRDQPGGVLKSDSIVSGDAARLWLRTARPSLPGYTLLRDRRGGSDREYKTVVDEKTGKEKTVVDSYSREDGKPVFEAKITDKALRGRQSGRTKRKA